MRIYNLMYMYMYMYNIYTCSFVYLYICTCTLCTCSLFIFSEAALVSGAGGPVSNGDVVREGGEVERQGEGGGRDEVFSEPAVVLPRRHHSIMRASGECSHAWRSNSWTAKCTFTKPSTLTTHPPVSPTIPLSPSPSPPPPLLLQVWLSQTRAQRRG